MKVSAAEILAAISALGVAGGLIWIGTLDNRVTQLEKQAEDLRIGPRGQNCQQIVGKLVERPEDPALRALAAEWGCPWMPAVQVNEGAPPSTKTCHDGRVVEGSETCPATPPPPPPPKPEPER